MKKSLKYFLIGTGMIAAGLFVYTLYKKGTEEGSRDKCAEKMEPSESSNTHHSNQEHIDPEQENFREQIVSPAVSEVFSESSEGLVEESLQTEQDISSETEKKQDTPAQESGYRTDLKRNDEISDDCFKEDSCMLVATSKEDTISDEAGQDESVTEESDESRMQEESEEDRSE